MLNAFFSGRSLTRHQACAPSKRRQHLVLEELETRCLLTVDPIMEWNANAIEVNRVSYSGGVVNDQIGPTRSSRALAIEHVAMFDAWNSIHRTFNRFLTQAPNAAGASDVAAVGQAAHDTLLAMYPHQATFINTALRQTLRRVPNGTAKTRGIDVGKFVARAILANRTNDGSQIAGQYNPDGHAGHHVADPLNPNQGFLTPAWGGVRTFGIRNTAQVPTREVPAMTGDEFTDAFNQVKDLGINLGRPTTRTTDQTELGIFWGYDVARGLGDPPRLYNQIARVIADQQGNTVGQNARMFALINVAMADAGIQCWGVKYRDVFWRPIVAIRRAGEVPNPDIAADPTWEPLGAPLTNPLPTEHVNFTPPFPAYTSGHATFGGAAFKMMADFFQTNDIDIRIPFDFISDEFNGVSRDIHEQIPDLVMNFIRDIKSRHFTSFSQAAAENAASRIFLGIHWRFDAIEGVRAGDRIADIDFDTKMRPRALGSPRHIPSVDFTSQIDAYLNNTYGTFFGNGGGSAPVRSHNDAQPIDEPPIDTPSQRFVAQVYMDLLEREAEPGGLAFWSGQMDHGMPASEIVSAITSGAEYRTLQVQDMYTQMLHRSADAAGLRGFVDSMSTGATLDQVAAAIAGSAEYFQTRGESTNAGFLSALYQDQLNRAVDPTGQAGFTNALTGGVARNEVAMAVMTSAENRGNVVDRFYETFLNRQADDTGRSASLAALSHGMDDLQLITIMLGSKEYMDAV